jgi:hypothetical protein
MFTTSCHFPFVNLFRKNDEDYVKGNLSKCNHRLLDHAHLGQVRIVK